MAVISPPQILRRGLWPASVRRDICRNYLPSVRASGRVEPAHRGLAIAGIVGVVCSAVPTALYLRLLARAASVPAALVAYLQPVWATLLGWAILGEQVRAVGVAGNRDCYLRNCRHHPKTAVMTSFGSAVVNPRRNAPTFASDRHWVSSSLQNFAIRPHSIPPNRRPRKKPRYNIGAAAAAPGTADSGRGTPPASSCGLAGCW